jgi:choline monooxygenase
VWNIN